jgi:NAD+ diphosphatase
MPFPLFGAPWPEPSAAVGFAGNPLDRRSEARGDDAVAEALADRGARLVLIAENRLWIRAGTGGGPLFSVDEVEAPDADTVLLGWDEKGPVLAMPLSAEAAPPGAEAIELRAAHAGALLPRETIGIAAQAAALLAWHKTHRFCSRCGQPSAMRGGGVKRACPACGAEHFPRTDPVAIMLAVLPDGRCLMGRGRHFAPGMYSCLAGFIEPGETMEDAVRRETFEESGVRLGRVAFHASQPWPFPHSLMLGCFGEALGEEIRRDEAELEDCRWFGRDEVLAMLAGTHPDGLRVPPAGAIATHLIRAWAEG